MKLTDILNEDLKSPVAFQEPSKFPEIQFPEPAMNFPKIIKQPVPASLIGLAKPLGINLTGDHYQAINNATNLKANVLIKAIESNATDTDVLWNDNPKYENRSVTQYTLPDCVVTVNNKGVLKSPVHGKQVYDPYANYMTITWRSR